MQQVFHPDGHGSGLEFIFCVEGTAIAEILILILTGDLEYTHIGLLQAAQSGARAFGNGLCPLLGIG